MRELRSGNAYGHFIRAMMCCWRHRRGHRFVRACAVEMYMDISQEPFCVKNHKKKWPGTLPGDNVLCEPAQSKCTWTFHKSHFAWKLTGKMPNAKDTTSIEHPGLNSCHKNPSVWPRCLGKYLFAFFKKGNKENFFV